jgi:hypothetical protein
MGGGSRFTVIDPWSGKSPPPVFSNGPVPGMGDYGTVLSLVRRAGHGAEGVLTRYYVAASSLGTKTLKFYCTSLQLSSSRASDWDVLDVSLHYEYLYHLDYSRNCDTMYEPILFMLKSLMKCSTVLLKQ